MITVHSIPGFWLLFIVALLGVVDFILLVWLQQQRRLLMGDPQRRHFFMEYIQRRRPLRRKRAVSLRHSASANRVTPPAAVTPAVASPLPIPGRGIFADDASRPRAAAVATTPVQLPTHADVLASRIASGPVPTRDQAVVYVDAAGRCTFASDTARAIFEWSPEELALGDVLAGGPEEATALLQSLARQGFVAQHATTLVGMRPRMVEITAVAFRDRDGRLSGAALFISPLAVASATSPAGATDLLSARSPR